MRDSRLFRSPRSKFIQARIRGKRVSTGCTDERAAGLWADEEERRRASPRYAAASAATLGPCVDDYMAEMRRRKSAAATLDKEERRAGHFLHAWGEAFRMERIDARLVEEYIAARESGTVEIAPVKQITVHDELGTLRGILKVAKHHGLWRGEIVEVMPIAYARKHTPKKRAPSPEEVKKLMEQFPMFRSSQIAYIVATGCRISESFRARRADVNKELSTVHIHGTKTVYADDDIPITRITREWLEWAVANAPGKDKLFSPWGKYWRDWKAACVRAGIEQITPNDLRRSLGHWHRTAGAHVPDVARMLRHGDDRLAQTTYARIGAETQVAVLERQLGAGDEQKPSTSDLHGDSDQNSPNEDQLPKNTAENLAPPARVELATLALGKRGDSARVLAAKQAWERRRVAASTLNLHLPVCANCGAISGHRVFEVVGSRVLRVAS